MKLMRLGAPGAEKPAVMHADGRARDISHLVGDLKGDTLSLAAIAAVRAADLTDCPTLPADARIGPCLADAPNIFCIGRNYAEHARETGAEVPKEPMVFNKATSALSGPFDPIVLPPGSAKVDWEAELAAVIGAPCFNVSEDEALDYVTGYCAFNDVSERAWQKERGGQFVKGKSAPSFAPVGPYLLTADEVPDPQALSLTLKVNGETMQDGTTADMIFPVRTLISALSRHFMLRPGDVLATGTPSGVGAGMNPPRFLRHGDTVELTVERLGAQRCPVHDHGRIRA